MTVSSESRADFVNVKSLLDHLGCISGANSSRLNLRSEVVKAGRGASPISSTNRWA